MANKLTLIGQLRVMAGVEADTNRFGIQRDGRAISVVFKPGTSDTLELTTPYPGPEAGTKRPAGFRGVALPLTAPRPLRIHLFKESRLSVRLKEMGIEREVELGDPLFDQRVYINSPSGDDIIKAVLAEPGARAAVIELLERDAASIVIDDKNGQVGLNLVRFTEREPDQERAVRMLDALGCLVSALPSVSPTPEGRPADVAWAIMVFMGITGFIGVIGTPLAYFRLGPEYCLKPVGLGDETKVVCSAGPECCTPGYVGLGVGVLIAVLLSVFFFFTVRGRSDSFTRMIVAILSTSVFVIEASVIVARLVW